MQSAKDTFLLMLRDGLAVINPARTVVVRGALRPAVIAAENELPQEQGELRECFQVRWKGSQRDVTEPLPLHSMECEICWSTVGTGELGGLDRGRVMAAMETELRKVLAGRHATKKQYGGTTPVVMATEIFWEAPPAVAVTEADDALRAVMSLMVFALEEGSV